MKGVIDVNVKVDFINITKKTTNMAYAKWIGALSGWTSSHSVLGALAGFALGALFDAIFDRKQSQEQEQAYQEQAQHIHQQQEGARNSFLFSLMVLSAHVIQADGKIMHSEMEHVRQFLRRSFGENAVEQGNNILLKLFDYRKRNGDTLWHQQIAEACHEMSLHMETEHRLQLMAFLCEIAKADGNITESEITALHSIAVNLRLNANIVEQMLHLGGKTLDDAYAVLGITKDATDEEVRMAYRKMALQYHPDKVATLGDDVKLAAQKKFQEINEAKERIYKARGL